MSSHQAWPQDLLQHAARRNLVILVGAGISASSKNAAGDSPPNWSALLSSAADAVDLGRRRNEFDDLLQSDRLLEAAEMLRMLARQKSRTQDLLAVLKLSVDGPRGDFFAGSEWHDQIVRAEPKVILTTNYDKILERATNSGYNVHEYKSGSITADIRRNEPVLLKIHGSVDHIEDVVLSRRDYADVRHRGRHAMEVIHALMLTRPALLLGYRLHDPDLQLILENIFAGDEQVPAHYMLAPDSIPDYERDVLEFSFGVNVITYPDGKHSAALELFTQVADIVASTPPNSP